MGQGQDSFSSFIAAELCLSIVLVLLLKNTVSYF